MCDLRGGGCGGQVYIFSQSSDCSGCECACIVGNHSGLYVVAEYVGVSRQAVAKWEGGISDPSTSNLIALAKLFDMDVNQLIGGCNE